MIPTADSASQETSSGCATPVGSRATQPVPPRGTRQHPVWCVTRQDWVGLGELLPGEEVETRQGPLAVRTVQDVPGLQSVYNLEVHGEHVYEVTDAGILVHNNNSAACLDFASLQRRIDLG